MNIDHIGIVVKDMEAAINQWTKLFGYRQKTEEVVNSKQLVKIVFMHKPDSPIIKLVMPIDESSPAYRFARRGGGLHHLCFRCNSIEDEIVRLEEFGAKVLAFPQPGEAFDNENIAFLYVGMGLNIELIDTDKKAKLISSDDNSRFAPE
jgi:methylmalonyl-CoA/ethylmalonyl-CoA epimerase